MEGRRNNKSSSPDIFSTLSLFSDLIFGNYRIFGLYGNTIEEISAIQYGTPIPEEYKSDVLRVLEG